MIKIDIEKICSDIIFCYTIYESNCEVSVDFINQDFFLDVF